MAVAAGFAAGKMGSNMDPALKALDDYADATNHLKGITLTQEEKDSNTANIQSLFSLFTGRLQDIHQGTTFDEAAYATQVDAVKKVLMDQISAAKARGQVDTSEGSPPKKAKVGSAPEQAASYDRGGHVLPQPGAVEGPGMKPATGSVAREQTQGLATPPSGSNPTNLIQTTQNVQTVKPVKHGGSQH